jgi:hypothetical protein
MAEPAEDPNKILKETVETVAALNDAFNSLGAMIKSQLTANIVDADDYTKQYVKSIQSDATRALNGLGKSSDRILQNQIKINEGQAKSKDISNQIKEVTAKSEKIQNSLKNAAQADVKFKSQAEILAKQIQEVTVETVDALKAQNKEAEKLEVKLKAQQETLTKYKKTAKDLSSIPLIGKLIDQDKLSSAMTKAANEQKSVFAAGFKEVSKNITSALTSGVSIIKFFLDAAFKANKQSVELGKSLGYGAANSDRVRENFVRMEHSSDNINVNTANLAEASNQLTESTGYTAEFSQDQLETQIMLTKQLKLSSEEASGIYQFSVLQGKSANSTYQSMVRGYVATRNALKTSVPFKAAIAEAAKVSGQLASNLGNNPEKIIKAVVATRALGTSLEQAKSQGESLLDFQSSIENELKAELITGEQLNLERARAAALMGDQVTVANELAAQGMTSQKFSTMNVLAQKAYAEALGTTSDELANQLKKREIAISQGKSLAQVTAEEADAAAKRQDIQEKFNVAMDKIKSVIGNLLAGPLSQFLESLSQGLVYINEMVNKFGKVASTIKGMLGPDGFKLLGSVAGAATVGALILAVGKSLMKGTRLNPVVVTVAGGGGGLGGDGGDVSTGGGGKGGGGSIKDKIFGKKAGGQFKKGGGRIPAGGRAGGMFSKKALGGLTKGLGKKLLGGNALTALAMGGLEAYSNMGTGMGSGESIGRALLSGGGSLLGGALGSFAGPLGTIGGGVGGGMAGGALGDYFFGEKPEAIDQTQDGIATSGGPFQIKNKYGQTSITAAGDKLAVSPNISGGSPMDLSPMIAAINQVTAAVADLKNKSWDVHLDSKAVGTGLIQKSYRSA